MVKVKRSLVMAVGFLSCYLICSCGSDEKLNTLKKLEARIDTDPMEVFDSLKGMNTTSFSKQERIYHDFLKVKAMDKAYVLHTSDSVIREVIDYSASHRKQIPYAEALYYGGRVYSDMGDYPTALSCFHKAIFSLDSARYSNALRSKIYSQTGRLLNSMGLHEEAIPHIEEAIRLTDLKTDTVNLVYDLQLLGGIYLQSGKYADAERYFKQALEECRYMPDHHKAKCLMYLAAVKEGQGDLETAHNLIEGISDRVKPIARNSALAYSAAIYSGMGNLDSAYTYSKEIIRSQYETNKKAAYEMLLSPQIRKRLPVDTLVDYVLDYASLLEKQMDQNDTQMVLTQQAMFNYETQDYKREKAEAKSSILLACCIGAVFIILLLLLVLLLVRDRKNRRIIELQNALVKTREVAATMFVSSGQRNEDSGTIPSQDEGLSDGYESKAKVQEDSGNTKDSPSKLQKQLADELLMLAQAPDYSYTVSPIILESEVYSKLQEHIEHDRIVAPDSVIWKELEKVVLQCSPKFKANLCLLTEGKLTSYDLQTALLVKSGISPKHMVTLLGRSKGAIVSRRDSISIRIFGEKRGTKIIDNIIRLL